MLPSLNKVILYYYYYYLLLSFVGYVRDRYVTLRCSFVGCIYCPKVTQFTLASRRSVKPTKEKLKSEYIISESRHYFLKTFIMPKEGQYRASFNTEYRCMLYLPREIPISSCQSNNGLRALII